MNIDRNDPGEKYHLKEDPGFPPHLRWHIVKESTGLRVGPRTSKQIANENFRRLLANERL